MAKKWWAVQARVQADSMLGALNELRRVGTMPENVAEINDQGGFSFDRSVETLSPWHDAGSAPKVDGKRFLAYDRHIQLIETAHWDENERKFLNEVGDDEVKFTEWLERPDE